MVSPLPGSVLVVDDEAQVFSTFRNVAKNLPIRLRFALNAEEALRMVAAEIPELLICDYLLGTLDGLELIQKVQRAHPRVKGILYTAQPIGAWSRGVDIPVLSKPCAPENLRELLCALTTPGKGVSR